MGKIIITGGTGFLGLSAANYLKNKGYDVVIIARTIPKQNHGFTFAQWDAETTGDWVNCLEGAQAIVNLAGRTVDCIKTPDHCDEILRSRVESTKVIGAGLKTLVNPPKVWIQMATAHIYGDPPKTLCTEQSAAGYGLAPTVGKAWEKAFKDALPHSMRGVIMRTSFVIGRNGGALASLGKLAKLGLGGKVASGTQGMSWIHEEDFNRFIHRSIEEEKFSGMYILSGPNPVSNTEFMHLLRRTLRMPLGLPSPEWLVRIGAKYLFRTDPELALYGRYVIPKRLLDDGFEFQYPDLEAALYNLIRE